MFTIINDFLINDFFTFLPGWIIIFIICNVIGKGVRSGR